MISSLCALRSAPIFGNPEPDNPFHSLSLSIDNQKVPVNMYQDGIIFALSKTLAGGLFREVLAA